MAYTDEQIDRADAIMEAIETAQANERRPYTYKDAENLRALAAIYESEHDFSDEETLENGIALSWFLAEAYAALGRYAPAAGYYTACVKLSAQKAKRCGRDETAAGAEDAEELLYTAVRARNYYEDDDCEDLDAPALDLLGAEADFDAFFACRRALLHDPVEASEAYLAVIDAVEEALGDTLPRAAAWKRKKELLAARAIAWRTPAEMNPDTHFAD